jgi:hypothetical protein
VQAVLDELDAARDFGFKLTLIGEGRLNLKLLGDLELYGLHD